jgi:acyl-coenzyme A synthetase/AMP-(fatty) acid ligase
MWLWGSLTASGAPPAGSIFSASARIQLQELAAASNLRGQLESLRGGNVLVAAKDQLTAALALIELDGVAQRIVLCPPDLSAAHVPAIVRDCAVQYCVADANTHFLTGFAGVRIDASPALTPDARLSRRQSHETEWILLTSGTTGAPKLVRHTLASLTSGFSGRQPADGPLIWSTFYDIRRYGGLQIFLRALHHGSLVLSSAEETTGDFLARAAAAGVTHISGTPSHWRKALMSGTLSRIAPRYVRLSGEIADQAILDSLRKGFPAATVAHAFASTEAGVGFEVRDGLAGFPATLAGIAGAAIEIDVSRGTLRLRSRGNAIGYLGADAPLLKDPDGFVDTGDLLALRDGRYIFMGRSGGVINVGGLKVYPEEVEAVINAHPWVRMSLVKARRNAITGAVVTAEVVLTENTSGSPPTAEVLKGELLQACRSALAAHKVPATIRIVPALAVSASGKLLRPDA